MKELADKRQVPARMYYYLLDWNDRTGWKDIMFLFNTGKLHELTLGQFMDLFKLATEKDLENLVEIYGKK